MRTLILLALFMVCSVVQAAQTKGVAYNPSTLVVIQTNLTQTFETNNVTDELNVGVAGQQGVITLKSTNGTYAVTLSLDANGTFFVKYGSSNMLSVLVGTNSGHTGAGTKYLADGGAFVTPASPIGNITNININPTDNFLPYRSNATTFGDSPLVLGTNTLYAKFGSTTSFLVNSNSGFTGAGTKFLSDDGTYIANPFYFNSGLGFIENVDHTQEQFRIVNTANSGLSVFATAGSQAMTLGTNFTIAPYNPDSTANPAFLFDATADWTTTNLVFRVRDNGGTPLFAIAGESGWTGAGTLVLTDDGTYKSVTGAGGITANSTNTLSNKTYNTSDTGNVFTQRRSIKLQIPRLTDGSGCMATNTNYVALENFMVPIFSGSADTNANYCYWITRVPEDFNASGADVTASITVTLGGSDADAASFTLGMVSVANGAAGLSATAANYNAITVTPTSAAAGDVESSNANTLTGWKAAMTANQFWKIQLQRVDNSNDDAIAMQELEIFYDSTQ